MNTLFMQSDAAISPCGRYRWSLSRCWDRTLLQPWIGWLMLNPSTADASVDDATIRRCIGFTQRWQFAGHGFGGLTVRNLYTLRTTYPKELQAAEDAIGPDADKLILDMVGDVEFIVCAWGAYSKLNGRDKVVIEMLRNAGAKLVCLGRTKEGHPRHPVRLASNTMLVDF